MLTVEEICQNRPSVPQDKLLARLSLKPENADSTFVLNSKTPQKSVQIDILHGSANVAATFLSERITIILYTTTDRNLHPGIYISDICLSSNTRVHLLVHNTFIRDLNRHSCRMDSNGQVGSRVMSRPTQSILTLTTSQITDKLPRMCYDISVVSLQ